LRIGEAIVLGRETAFGNKVEGCYNDCFLLKGEIIEIKQKPSVPEGKIGMDAFGKVPSFKDKGVIKRAIIALGRQDLIPEGLEPLDKNVEILGASSDHLIVNISNCEKHYKIGDIMDLKMDYGCLLRVMTSPYVKKYYV
jgi:predicted amino acid racemase